MTDQDRKLMSMVIDWKNEIGKVAGPFLPTDTKQSWLGRAARKCGVSPRLIRSLYYGHTTDPKFSVAKSVLSAAQTARLEEARAEARKLSALYLQIIGDTDETNKNLNSNDIAALIHAAGELGSMDRTRN